MSHFTPYEGAEPYIFTSYAHANSPAVMEVIEAMHARGYRIWYDEGIEVGSEWPECIAEHLSQAHLMLAFISDAYMKSDNCRREMHYALSKRIKVINIFLEPTQMTPGMEMQIGNIFALMKYSMPSEAFYERLYNAPLLNSESFSAASAASPAQAASPDAQSAACIASAPTDGADGDTGARRDKGGKNKSARSERADSPPREKRPPEKRRRLVRRIVGWGIAVLLFAAIITLGTIGHFTGLAERVLIRVNAEEAALLPAATKAEFTSAAFEDIARRYSGIESGDIFVSDLSGLTELYIASGYAFTPDDPSAVYPLAEDALRDLGDLQYFTGLNTLHINGHPLSSLATMPALNIQYLDISACRVSSLEGVGRLQRLRELTATGCPVTELGDIRQCLDLRALDLNGSTLTDFSALKPLTKLTEFSVSSCTAESVRTVMRMSGITDLAFYDCDLRGRFFKGFDKESNISSLALYNCKLDELTNLEDFSGLTTLTLASSGESLAWTAYLPQLPALSRVYVDAAMQDVVTRALATRRDVSVLPLDAPGE